MGGISQYTYNQFLNLLLYLHFTLTGEKLGLVADKTTREFLCLWNHKKTCFVLSEEEQERYLKLIDPELARLCKESKVSFIVKRNGFFYNMNTGSSFYICSEEYPGSADDAATYVNYSIHRV